MMFSPMPTSLEEAKREILSWREMHRQQVAEVKQLRQDAKRYRWLRNRPTFLGWEHDFRADEVDAAIDAAMQALQRGFEKVLADPEKHGLDLGEKQ